MREYHFKIHSLSTLDLTYGWSGKRWWSSKTDLNSPWSRLAYWQSGRTDRRLMTGGHAEWVRPSIRSGANLLRTLFRRILYLLRQQKIWLALPPSSWHLVSSYFLMALPLKNLTHPGLTSRTMDAVIFSLGLALKKYNWHCPHFHRFYWSYR